MFSTLKFHQENEQSYKWMVVSTSTGCLGIKGKMV